MTPLRRLVLAYHLVKLAGLLVNLVAFPVLRRRPAADGPAGPAVSLLVPARDEEARLPSTLAGLTAQPALEILVLDDGSSDGTAGVVSGVTDERVRLLAGEPCPGGWTGKNWACHQLAKAARGDVLVFVDADVSLAPGALAAVLHELDAQRADLLSVFPRQETRAPGERLLVPLIDETLLGFLPHPLLGVPLAASAATANGQLLAFRRAAYDRLGGHAAVAGDLVEDIALARRTRAAGLGLGLALGGDLVRARMYDGYRSSVAGFGKSLRAALGGSRLLLALSAVWHLAAYTLPWLLPRSRGWRLLAALGVAERLLVNAKTGRGAYAEAALVPVTAPAALPVYAVAWRRAARWKGREYR